MSKSLEVTMTFAALASIVVISLRYLIELSPAQLFLVNIIDLTIVLVFATEFMMKIRGQKDRRGFVKGHWYEVFAMLPAILFEALEAQASFGAALRSLRIIRLLRLIGMASRFLKLGSNISEIIKASRLVYLTTITSSAIFLSTLGIYLMERDVPGSQISNLSEALWWSINTISTVALPAGNPVTPQGRVMASVVIFAGVAFVGIFTSLLTSALIERRLRWSQPKTKKAGLIKAVTDSLVRLDELSHEEVLILRRMVDVLLEERLKKQAND